jgi:integrase
VFLIPPAVTWIERWLKERGSGPGLVWGRDDGGCHAPGYDAGWADTIGRMQKDGTRKINLGARSLAGITRNVRLHDLRHTCASHLISGSPAWRRRGWIRETLTMKEVSEWLGHSSTAITEKIYAHLLRDRVASKVGAKRKR